MEECGSLFREGEVDTSSRMMRRGSRTQSAWDNEMYSASMVDRAVSICSLLTQETGIEPRVITKPERDFK